MEDYHTGRVRDLSDVQQPILHIVRDSADVCEADCEMETRRSISNIDASGFLKTWQRAINSAAEPTSHHKV